MNAQIYEGYATEIVNALTAITPQSVANDRNTAWTRKIKEDIGGIGQKHEFKVCAAGCEGKFESEWLYDLIWYRNNKDIRLETIPLVLESEWSLDEYEIRFDFEKLLLANSPLKVMVFQNYGDTSERVFEQLRAGINEYAHGVASIFILACYQWNVSRFEIRTFKKEPNKAAEAIMIVTGP